MTLLDPIRTAAPSRRMSPGANNGRAKAIGGGVTSDPATALNNLDIFSSFVCSPGAQSLFSPGSGFRCSLLPMEAASRTQGLRDNESARERATRHDIADPGADGDHRFRIAELQLDPGAGISRQSVSMKRRLPTGPRPAPRRTQSSAIQPIAGRRRHPRRRALSVARRLRHTFLEAEAEYPRSSRRAQHPDGELTGSPAAMNKVPEVDDPLGLKLSSVEGSNLNRVGRIERLSRVETRDIGLNPERDPGKW
jgi:hypothetical protein